MPPPSVTLTAGGMAGIPCGAVVGVSTLACVNVFEPFYEAAYHGSGAARDLKARSGGPTAPSPTSPTSRWTSKFTSPDSSPTRGASGFRSVGVARTDRSVARTIRPPQLPPPNRNRGIQAVVADPSQSTPKPSSPMWHRPFSRMERGLGDGDQHGDAGSVYAIEVQTANGEVNVGYSGWAAPGQTAPGNLPCSTASLKPPASSGSSSRLPVQRFPSRPAVSARRRRRVPLGQRTP